jgi:hypothetical protein
LFPDSLPKMDDLFLPGGPPSADEMPLPDVAVNLSDALSRGERPFEASGVPKGFGWAAESATALVAGQEVALAAAPAVGPGDNSLRRSPPGAVPMTSQRAEGQDSLRPYQVALGLLPFLPAFGFTPVSLREKVLAGRRLWKTWRQARRRRSG